MRADSVQHIEAHLITPASGTWYPGATSQPGTRFCRLRADICMCKYHVYRRVYQQTSTSRARANLNHDTCIYACNYIQNPSRFFSHLHQATPYVKCHRTASNSNQRCSDLAATVRWCVDLASLHIRPTKSSSIKFWWNRGFCSDCRVSIRSTM